ncbi:hypothetical protein ACO2KH_17985 [Leptospira terpstrae]|uniref:hypothetical protein n=1 Tax=Leptospira terpstrae TaxID=293075 RepID=UPI003D02ACF5
MKYRNKLAPIIMSVTLLAVIFVGVYCSSGVVRNRFEIEESCPEEKIKVKSLGGGAFLAEGCGKKQSYVCLEAQWNTICKKD